MKKADRTALFALPIVILIGLGFAWAGSQGGASFSGISLFAFSVGLAFLVQWLALSQPTSGRPKNSSTSPAASHTSR